MPSSRLFVSLLAAISLTGCAGAMRQYSAEVGTSARLIASNNLDAALSNLEKNNSSKDMLYFLEKGELLRQKGDLPASTETWRQADAHIRIDESDTATGTAKLTQSVATYLVNDKVGNYPGEDFEKVVLSSRLALNHIAQNNWDMARVEIKKSHEREALIARAQEKQVAELQEKQKSAGGTSTSIRELKGYPVETIDNPEVNALVNSYQSAFSHYLAGFVYEALGEPGLAAAGYRKAIELRPNLPILESALAGLDDRTAPGRTSRDPLPSKNDKKKKQPVSAAPPPKGAEVLIVLENGLIPGKKSVPIHVNVPYIGADGFMKASFVALSFPTIVDSQPPTPVQGMLIDGQPVPMAEVTNYGNMAKRALKDAMPMIMVRTISRAAVRIAAQRAAERQGEKQGGALLGAIAKLAVVAAGAITEQADERSWRLLPATTSIARLNLPAGEHVLTVRTQAGDKSLPFTVSGNYAVLPVRINGLRIAISGQPVPTEPDSSAAADESNIEKLNPRVKTHNTSQAGS